MVLWKANSFEFFFNSVFWSFVLLIPLFYLGRASGVLFRHDDLEYVEEPEEETDAHRGFWAPA